MPSTAAVPVEACRFRVGSPFTFAATKEDGNDDRVPVELLAKTGKPVEHWYWETIIHDMSGLKIHKDSLPIDYVHDPDQILGYLDEFNIDGSGDLIAKGYLLPALESRAEDVVQKHRAGVPYEASISWDAEARIEWIPEGVETEVNGQTYGGPIYVVREWQLRGVAICPYGVDKDTKTRLSGGAAAGVKIFTTQPKEPVMPKPKMDAATEKRTLLSIAKQIMGLAGEEPADAAPTKDAIKPAPEQPAKEGTPPDATRDAAGDPPPAEPDRATEGKRFTDAFGEHGAALFAEGRTFDEARDLFAAAQAKQIGALSRQVTDLKTKLTAARSDLGEGDPASFTAEGTTPAPASGAGPSTNLDRFTAGIKLPTSPVGDAG